jgi:hypothetical protein
MFFNFDARCRLKCASRWLQQPLSFGVKLLLVSNHRQQQHRQQPRQLEQQQQGEQQKWRLVNLEFGLQNANQS